MTQFRNFGTPNNFWTNRPIRFKFGTDIEDGPLLRMDHKTTLNEPGLGHVTQFRNFWTPNNFWTNRAIRFKFGTNIDDGPLLRLDHKMTPKRACPGSRDQISKLWDPLITFEPIEISASNLAQTYITDSYSVRILKLPQSGRGLGHVTKFRNFGTPNNFWTNRAIRFKFGTNIEDEALLRLDHKKTPKWACPGSCDQISKFWTPLQC